MDDLQIRVYADADSVAEGAAKFIALRAREAVEARGRFAVALSGGRTPWLMLRKLAGERVPWEAMQVLQVDERVAPAGSPERNLTHLRESLVGWTPLRAEQIHAMPVTASDLEAGAARYAEKLRELCGTPAVIDLVHLGIGADGHTASLVPLDPVLEVTDADVALTGGAYQGRRRMSLTFPVVNRARRILWVVTGREKAEMLARLRDGDQSIPAGRVRRDTAAVFADRAAAARLNRKEPRRDASGTDLRK
jgi:6-phosphogluconolactonase